jgi:hypothetical protein
MKTFWVCNPALFVVVPELMSFPGVRVANARAYPSINRMTAKKNSPDAIPDK